MIPVAPPPDGTQASQVISIAMQYLGVPYVWGGASPSQGFDCSGLTMFAFAQIGVSLPHQAASQYNYGVPLSLEELQPADLVFFNGLGHMGIYICGGQFIHAPHTGDVVKISSIYDYLVLHSIIPPITTGPISTQEAQARFVYFSRPWVMAPTSPSTSHIR